MTYVCQEELVADAEQTIALAHARDGEPLLIIGESLDAGVAAAVNVGQHEAIAGLLLFRYAPQGFLPRRSNTKSNSTNQGRGDTGIAPSNC